MAEFLESFVKDFWGTLAEMSPYLLFGFLAAGVLSVFISAQLVERHLGRKGFLAVVVRHQRLGYRCHCARAVLIPVAMSLRKHRASKGATISFLLSTPQTGADSILVTLSLLGPIYAVFRPLAALATGLDRGRPGPVVRSRAR